MRSKLTLVLLVFLANIALAQIPSAGFESWKTTNTDKLATWNSIGKVTQFTPSNSGNYAAKIESSTTGFSPISAIQFGAVNTTTFQFSGGIPFTDTPDTLRGSFQYDIPAGDSALILAMFKKNGSPINTVQLWLKGTQTGAYKQHAFRIPPFMAGAPDTLILLITSTNPFKIKPGGYVTVDDLHFTEAGNPSKPLPNGDFESWNAVTYQEPAGWATTNSIAVIVSDTVFPVTQSTDFSSGSYSMRMENILAGGSNLIPGIALTGNQVSDTGKASFPVTNRFLSLRGAFKYNPVNQDTAFFTVYMFEKGVKVGAGYMKHAPQTANFSNFAFDIQYDTAFTGTPDSAGIILAATNPSNPKSAGSVLLVDDLVFSMFPASVGVAETKGQQNDLVLFPNPAKESATLSFSTSGSEFVSVELSDLTGKSVKTCFSGIAAEGMNLVRIDTNGLQPGFYLCTVSVNGTNATRKLVIE